MRSRMMMIGGGVAAAALLAIPLIALARGDGAGAVARGPEITIALYAAGNPTAAVDPRDGTGLVAWIATEAGGPTCSWPAWARTGTPARPCG